MPTELNYSASGSGFDSIQNPMDEPVFNPSGWSFESTAFLADIAPGSTHTFSLNVTVNGLVVNIDDGG